MLQNDSKTCNGLNQMFLIATVNDEKKEWATIFQ
ncbi:hypothetical protein SAM19_04399 [Brevibacillus laterosporus]|nr:hypothetical protein [Brevibacillus laterosporus]